MPKPVERDINQTPGGQCCAEIVVYRRYSDDRVQIPTDRIHGARSLLTGGVLLVQAHAIDLAHALIGIQWGR